MNMKILAIGALGAILLAGCSSAEPDATGGQTQNQSTTQSGTDGDGAFLEPFGLQDAAAKDVIAALERTEADKTAGVVGSIRTDHIVFSTPAGEQTMPLPEDEFYVSIAPYVDATHECFYHNLATCQGELVEEELDVTITTEDGDVLVDEKVTTYQNGFVGFWLPRDIKGTITFSHEGKSVEAPIGTGEEDPTCVTTLQLT